MTQRDNSLEVWVSKHSLFFLALILLIALGLRLWGIQFGLPYLYHADEPNKIMVSQNMVKTGDLNPHYYLKPTFFIYLNALAYVPYYFIGNLIGIFKSFADIPSIIEINMGVGYAPKPSVVLLGRLLTTSFGVASVFLVYLVGYRLTNRKLVGLLAALMMAFSPANCLISRYITPDMFVVFWGLATFLASYGLYTSGKTRYYILAGIACGLAISTKYNGCVTGIMIVSAHFLRIGWKNIKSGLKDWHLYASLLMVPLAFLATTPYAILDSQNWWSGLSYEFTHYSSSGHQGMEGNVPLWYLEYLVKTE